METKKLESLMNSAADARLLNAAENVLMPMLASHMQAKVDIMCANFRKGDREFVADVAQLAYIQELLSSLKSAQTRGNKAIDQLNKNQEQENV